MTDYEIQENFLRKVAQMYTTFNAEPIADDLAARFHYSSMWVCDEIKNRTAYLYYITRKLEANLIQGVFHYNDCLSQLHRVQISLRSSA